MMVTDFDVTEQLQQCNCEQHHSVHDLEEQRNQKTQEGGQWPTVLDEGLSSTDRQVQCLSIEQGFDLEG